MKDLLLQDCCSIIVPPYVLTMEITFPNIVRSMWYPQTYSTINIQKVRSGLVDVLSMHFEEILGAATSITQRLLLYHCTSICLMVEITFSNVVDRMWYLETYSGIHIEKVRSGFVDVISVHFQEIVGADRFIPRRLQFEHGTSMCQNDGKHLLQCYI